MTRLELSPRLLISSLAAAALLFSSPLTAADPFAEGVRSTPWLKPEAEQRQFRLPPGFEIELVAAEPDIQKPLNMAFDERGRLWLTCTVEYPYAVPLDARGHSHGRDSIRILEDADGDGRYEKVTTFADGLNIPMGIYPHAGGCIAFSIPHLWRLSDRDGDGKCDERTPLYGPFDHTRDTHGMVNALRRGYDGWLYACHGFNNQSQVRGGDGESVQMQSGNTFRVGLDGSRIEHFTHGQVNPFGMCCDSLGRFFTADCHTKPIYQLVPGGWYPSFGKPHDGLGFIPPMMDHLHGSTAIAGVTIYTGDHFPPAYRGLFFSGNVMTSRINCNRPETRGATLRAAEQPDFLSCDDPWFRPVEVQVGPDGALYILDFYNRIIGHYEVPLTHPGRDRTSGRIWRVVYRGDHPESKPLRKSVDLTRLTPQELVAELAHSNTERRLRVQHYLADVIGAVALPAVEAAGNSPKNDEQAITLLWLLHQLQPQRAAADGLRLAADGAASEPLRIHALRVLAAAVPAKPAGAQPKVAAAASVALSDKSPLIRQAAAELLARLAPAGLDEPAAAALARALAEAPASDPILRQSLRIALRNAMQAWPEGSGPAWRRALATGSPEQQRELGELALVAASPGATEFVLALLGDGLVDPSHPALDFSRLAAAAPDQAAAARLVSALSPVAGNDRERAGKLILALAAGFARSRVASPELSAWAERMANELLAPSHSQAIAWRAAPVPGAAASASPWVIQPRASQDGDQASPFFSSLPQGETLTGVYRSEPFTCPPRLSFWCAGHSGVTGKPINDRNFIRLRAHPSGELLVEARPPRNDTAHKIEWSLDKHAGKEAVLELIDADTATGFAWLAVGRFSLAALNPSDALRRQQMGCELAQQLQLRSAQPQLIALVRANETDAALRTSAAQALAAVDGGATAQTLALALGQWELTAADRNSVAAALATGGAAARSAVLKRLFQLSALRQQTILAESLAGDAAGGRELLALVASGQAAPRVLAAASLQAKFQLLGGELARAAERASADLPTSAAAADQLIAARKVAVQKAPGDAARGAAVFQKQCAACHQLAGQGKVIGPQLDGVGGRGLDRLLEDLLDPNRNVDPAFRTLTVQTTAGRVLSGLVRREEGQSLVLADAQGKEFVVAKSEIEAQSKTAISLMPSNLGETLPAGDFADLVAFLLTQRAANK